METAIHVGGAARQVHLKLEGSNPCGSVKDRTALSLVDDLEARDAIAPGSSLVESTSGNLGVALASIALRRGYRFIAVVDPKTTRENLTRMRALGAEIELVTEPDEAGCFLAARLERVRELCASSNAFVWPDQYSSPAGPRAHEFGTGPEVLGQLRGSLDAIFVPVSTGGTLAGLAACLRRESPATHIVAVDAIGSRALGGEPSRRLLTGIGAGRSSTFLTTDHYDERVYVSDAQAFSFCRRLALATGLRVGGSSGATLAACARVLARDPGIGRAVCICPDRGEAYGSTIYDDDWLARNGIDPGALALGPVEAITLATRQLAATA